MTRRIIVHVSDFINPPRCCTTLVEQGNVERVSSKEVVPIAIYVSSFLMIVEAGTYRLFLMVDFEESALPECDYEPQSAAGNEDTNSDKQSA